MRIAHFAKYTFNRIGGMERHVEILTRELAKRGHDVTVFSYDHSRLKHPETIDGVHVEPIPALLNLSSQSIAPSLICRARKLAFSAPYDVIHQHWPDPFAHIAATLIPGRPSHVVTWHSDIVRQRIIRPVYRTVARRLLVKPNALIGATHAHLTSPQIPCFAPPERRHVIPYSIYVEPYTETPEISHSARTLRNRFGNGPIIFALGRHVYYKGFEVLIRAMRRVDATLILGGQGPLTSQLVALANHTNVNVNFVGIIPDQQLPIYYHACDVFCLPSVATTEAFGLVQAEAMASGKPLVNTHLNNGVNELAPDGLCAITVRPNDEFALAGALSTLVTDSALRARLGSNGKIRVNTHYTVTTMVDRVEALYSELRDHQKT